MYIQKPRAPSNVKWFTSVYNLECERDTTLVYLNTLYLFASLSVISRALIDLHFLCRLRAYTVASGMTTLDVIEDRHAAAEDLKCACLDKFSECAYTSDEDTIQVELRRCTLQPTKQLSTDASVQTPTSFIPKTSSSSGRSPNDTETHKQRSSARPVRQQRAYSKARWRGLSTSSRFAVLLEGCCRGVMMTFLGEAAAGKIAAASARASQSGKERRREDPERIDQ